MHACTTYVKHSKNQQKQGYKFSGLGIKFCIKIHTLDYIGF